MDSDCICLGVNKFCKQWHHRALQRNVFSKSPHFPPPQMPIPQSLSPNPPAPHPPRNLQSPQLPTQKLPHTFRILPHTLQRACPLQRPLDPTRHNTTGRPGGREAGGREAGRPGGREAGRPGGRVSCLHRALRSSSRVRGN